MRKLLIALSSVVALACTAPTAQAAFPGSNGKIAFYTGLGTSDNIWVMQPNGSGLTQLTSLPNREWDPTWSPDGTMIALVVDQDIWTMDADGTNMVNLTNGEQGFSPTWSPDGSKIAFTATRANPGDFQSKIYVMNADGSDQHRITDGFTADSQPAWSPDGRIAFIRNMRLFKMNADGSNPTQVTNEATSASDPNWSPTGHRIAYTRSASQPEITTGIHIINPDGTNDVDLSGALSEAHDPAWSPDGSKLVVSRHGHVWTMNTDGSNSVQLTTTFGTNGLPDWQPLPFTGYARPKGASPMYLSLVPAYVPCTSPDREHGPPLAFPSCTPSQTSPNLTVGTPDANGAAASSIGALTFTVAVGTPGPPDDSDVKINLANVTDVRCATALDACGSANAAGGPDYTGQLQVRLRARLTDKAAATTSAEPTTTVDFDFPTSDSAGFPFKLDCAATASTAVGATCSTITTFNALVPGSVKDTRRAIWQFEQQVRVYDGGTDGVASTEGDNSLFAVPGVFVP